jgi:hypothetical protein
MFQIGTFCLVGSVNSRLMRRMSSKKGMGKKPPKNIVGPRIRKAREQFPGRLTQDQLSGRLAALGVSIDRVAIAKIEAGSRRVFDFEIASLASALNVDILWLLGGDS